jgi:hypothetical protein
MVIEELVDPIVRVCGPNTFGCQQYKKDCFLSISDKSISKIEEIYLTKNELEALLSELHTTYKEICDKEDGY